MPFQTDRGGERERECAREINIIFAAFALFLFIFVSFLFYMVLRITSWPVVSGKKGKEAFHDELPKHPYISPIANRSFRLFMNTFNDLEFL